ncbi:preprotein translocase subunit SecE [Solibaculum mannosilyticum]|uniref:preprotein translocase subunit SecE n=1 Tax=Solibaculum mannosilyticum TaxID=2780922 RepID=UPI0007A85FE5|nr:preprotein translocase subunit SecE [Eubacteriaceae bacterium CHKCI005]
MPEATTQEKSKSRFSFKKMGSGIAKFFRGYASEFKKIVWPTRKQVINHTLITIVMVIAIGIFIWLLDWGLGALLSWLLSLKG